MSQVAQRTIKLIIIGVIAVCGLAGILTTYFVIHNAGGVQLVADSQHQLKQISYQGQNGVDALSLLKKHADISVKHYSFGDLVTSIDGSAGNGPTYWTFYINGKESSVGAGAYITKDSDKLKWVLQ